MSDIYDGLKNTSLIEAVRAGQLETVKKLIASGVDVNEQGEEGWTPLCWAAGKGDVEVVKILVGNGAGLFKVGRDRRTPYMIALAAGHIEVVKFLREAENQVEREKPNQPERKYCKAHHLKDLRQYPKWFENKINQKDEKERDGNIENAEHIFSDDEIVYVHQDYTVTQSIWHGEDVIFNQVTSEWIEFCANTLGFKVPDDLDLIASTTSVQKTR